MKKFRTIFIVSLMAVMAVMSCTRNEMRTALNLEVKAESNSFIDIDQVRATWVGYLLFGTTTVTCEKLPGDELHRLQATLQSSF